MTFTEANTVEQIILDVTISAHSHSSPPPVGEGESSVLHWSTRLSGAAIAADFCSPACYA